MSDVILVLLRSLLSGCQSRRLLPLENLALRHQLTVLQRYLQIHRPRCAQRRLGQQQISSRADFAMMTFLSGKMRGDDIRAVTHSTRYMKPSTTLADRKSTRLNSSHLVISYAVF